jgi:hypothetical protein
MAKLTLPKGPDTKFYKFLETIKSNQYIPLKQLTNSTRIPYKTLIGYGVLAKKFGLIELYEGREGVYRITRNGIKYLDEERNRTYTCKVCGKPFKPSRNHPNQQFCSKYSAIKPTNIHIIFVSGGNDTGKNIRKLSEKNRESMLKPIGR